MVRSFVLFALLSVSLSAADALATLTARTGAVYQITEDESGAERSRAEIRPGTAFNGGEKIATAKGAKATLTFIDGTVVEVAENSQLSITPTDSWSDRGKNAVSLFFGYLVAKVQKITGDDTTKFQVTTPSSLAAVRGTVFGVGVGEDGSSMIGVEEGIVDVTSDIADGKPVSLSQNEGAEAGLGGGIQKKRDFALKNFDYGKWNEQNRDAFRNNPEAAMQNINKRFEASVKAMIMNEEATKQIIKKMREVAEARERAERARNPEQMKNLAAVEAKMFEALFAQKMQEKAIMGSYLSCRAFYGKMFEGAKADPEMMKKLAPSMKAMRDVDMKIGERKQEMKRVFEGNKDFMVARMKANNIEPEKVRERMEQRIREAQEKGPDRDRKDMEKRDEPKGPDRKLPPRPQR